MFTDTRRSTSPVTTGKRVSTRAWKPFCQAVSSLIRPRHHDTRSRERIRRRSPPSRLIPSGRLGRLPAPLRLPPRRISRRHAWCPDPCCRRHPCASLHRRSFPPPECATKRATALRRTRAHTGTNGSPVKNAADHGRARARPVRCLMGSPMTDPSGPVSSPSRRRGSRDRGGCRRLPPHELAGAVRVLRPRDRQSAGRPPVWWPPSCTWCSIRRRPSAAAGTAQRTWTGDHAQQAIVLGSVLIGLWLTGQSVCEPAA